VSDDEECIHLMDPALCSICNGKDAKSKPKTRTNVTAHAAPKPRVTRTPTPKAPTKRLTTSVVATRSADTEESVEEYRARYTGERESTFDAYVEVFFNTDARDFPGGFLAFTRCANAEAERKATAPALVLRAERLMRDAGYESEELGAVGGGRRWHLAV
jgi:hypothetical protein